MKAKFILLLLMLLATVSIDSQTIVFNKFKIEPGLVGKSLSIKYICNTEHTIKYITVYFTVLNGVRDEVPDINGLTELNLKCIGPIVGGKKYKGGYSVLINQPLPLTANPKRIEIEYVEDSIEDETIEITEDNLKTYFPKWEFKDKW